MDEFESLATLGNVDAIFEYCQERNYLPKGITLAIGKRNLAVYHSIWIAVMHYLPPPPPCVISLFTAEIASGNDYTLGWGGLIGKQLQIYPIGGTHQTIVELPLAEKLVQAMSDAAGL